MNPIGIMQGRLVSPDGDRLQTFPRNRFWDEFALACAAGLHCIEWIDDGHGADVNPIRTEHGIQHMRDCIHKTDIHILSLCADIFMEKPLVRCSESERMLRLEHLQLLLRQCAQIGARYVILPLIDHSSLQTEEEKTTVIECLISLLPDMQRYNVEIHIETDFSPMEKQEFLRRLPYDSIRVTYDTGNSASFGYNPQEEFAAYGNRIGSVHIKDRLYGGGSVPLGEGDTDFDAVFAGLRKIRYAHALILQAARGKSGDEVAWAKHNIRFIQQFYGATTHR